ncbi:hypothetical protein ACH5Y9_20570 [Methylomonas sp. BW4-1]|uniref:hypothetical protein n=1 Tax=Methylomonas sp. BW4-1 TaxID=3376685 RepID=UPI00404356EC
MKLDVMTDFNSKKSRTSWVRGNIGGFFTSLLSEGQFLRYAVDSTDIELVKLLLEIGANPNKVEDVVSIFTRLVSAGLNQCRCYLDELLIVGNQFRHGEISQRQCTLRQNKLKERYEENDFGILKLRIAKMLVDAGGDINYLMCHPLDAAIQDGMQEFRLIAFFLLYCDINWGLVYTDYDGTTNKAIVRLWKDIVDTLSLSTNIKESIVSYGIDELISLKQEDIFIILKKLYGKHFSYIEDHDDAFNCIVVKNVYGDEFELVGNGYALNQRKINDIDEFLFLIEPEDIKRKLDNFILGKEHFFYLIIGSTRIAFEIAAVEVAEDFSPYANRYVCKRRDDMHFSV